MRVRVRVEERLLVGWDDNEMQDRLDEWLCPSLRDCGIECDPTATIGCLLMAFCFC